MSEALIRPATARDRSSIDAVGSAAFGQHGAAVVRLIRELRRTGAAVLELVAEDEARCVGHVLLSRGWVDSVSMLVPVRVLSPLGVLPRAQRRGVGRDLIEQAVRLSDASGAPALFLEGDPAYYAKSAFDPAEARGFRSPSARIPSAAFQVRTLAAHRPEMAGRLVYPDAFWSCDAVGPPRNSG